MEAIDESAQLSTMRQAASVLDDEDLDESSRSSRRDSTSMSVVALGNTKRMTESGTGSKEVSHDMKDRISHLPLNLQEYILGFLPIRDAVKTSILSRRWKHCWTMIPQLIFDGHFLESMWDKESESYDRELMAYKFAGVIDKVLLLHNGPIIKFSLICPKDYNSHIFHYYNDKWIALLSKNGIKQITLQQDSHIGVHDFSSLDLTHLRLIRVWFPYTPESRGFSHMMTLELLDVHYSPQSIIDCPVLEKLTLIICEELFPTDFRAPKLKCLHHLYHEFTLECSAAGFKNLTEYSYTLLQDPELTGTTLNVVNVVGSLHKIEKFAAGLCFFRNLAAGGSPNRLSKPLPYLKTLDIEDVDLSSLSEVSCLLCLIRSAPNLCNLHIGLDNLSTEEDVKNYWIEENSIDCTIDHLEVVTFVNFKGLPAEMGLVKFLLAHSPLLKTMIIDRDEALEKNAALTMATEIVEYSRASSIAQVKYMQVPFQIDGRTDAFELEFWDYIFDL